MPNPSAARSLVVVAASSDAPGCACGAVSIVSPELQGRVPQAELAGSTVITLDAERDAIEQISQALAQQRNVRVVRVISHGEPGAIVLAGQRITAADLKARSAEVKDWGEALAGGAEILLYGCAVASTPAGQLLATTLAQLTGADVAASVDTTGAGGNLMLAYTTGRIDSGLAATQDEWDCAGLSLALPNQRAGSGASFEIGSNVISKSSIAQPL